MEKSDTGKQGLMERCGTYYFPPLSFSPLSILLTVYLSSFFLSPSFAIPAMPQSPFLPPSDKAQRGDRLPRFLPSPPLTLFSHIPLMRRTW